MDSELPSFRPYFAPTRQSSTIGKFSRPSFTPVGHDKIYAWGAREQVDDFIVFNWKTREWSICESTPSMWPSPGVRHAHTATHYICDGRSYIVIYGGYDGEMREHTTTHIFDVESGCWIGGVLSDENTPAARSFHTATYVCVDNEPYLFVVGGLHMHIGSDRSWAPPELCVLNLRTRKWYPSLNVLSRYGHAAVLIPGAKPRILILGGRDARGKHGALHFMVDVLAVLDLVHPALSIQKLSLSNDPSSSTQSCPWHSLGPIPNSAGIFYGTSNLWADRIHNVVYVFGQSKGDSATAIDSISESPIQTSPYSMWTLKFDAGWCKFEDISTYVLPLSSGADATERRERWLWFGVLDSGLKITRGDDLDGIDWNQVPNEPILLALNSSHDPPYESSVETNSNSTIRCLAVPELALSTGAVESRSDNSPRHADDWCNPSYARYLAPLWHPTQGKNPGPGSLSSSVVSRPDVAIHSLTHGAPPILAHSIIIGTRSSYFRMLLSNRTQNAVDSADAFLTTVIDEPYITAYSLVYYLYCNALPPLLTGRSVPNQTPQTMPHPHTSQIPPWESWAGSVNAAKLAADLLIAADKYLLPPSLFNLLRRCIMENHISSLNAIYFWRAAYLTRNQGDADAGDVFMVRDTRDRDGSCGNDGMVTPVRKPLENWLDRIVREAYEQRKTRPESSARAFLAEVGRWCSRRFDEDKLEVQVREEDSSGSTEGEGEDEESGNVYAVESEIMEAFWEEMGRLRVPIESPHAQ